jgi:hypothetical protein
VLIFVDKLLVIIAESLDKFVVFMFVDRMEFDVKFVILVFDLLRFER